jgi:hypothetical protein
MSALIHAFDARLSELTSYYKFIEMIERDSAALSLPKKKTWRTRPVDEKILRILKANFFLLLYNLVEATIREGFTAVYTAIETDGCSIRQLSLPLRKIWIDFEYSRLKPSTAHPDSYREMGRKLVQSVADDVRATLDVSALGFGGNLDARAIRKVCDEHGVSHRTLKRAKGGEKLLIVKNKRNALTHGVESFVECGRDFTVAQLGEIKSEAASYLRAILRNIDTFTQRKAYRV